VLKLNFKKSKTKKEIENIYNFNVGVFTNAPEVIWSLDSLNNEKKDGWELYAAKVEEEIVAVLFTKLDKGTKTLLTKNTPIKISFQGNGFSHQIKEFYELKAQDIQANEIVSLCSNDNFRMISLNETHGYKISGEYSDKSSNGQKFIKWSKKLI
jgi:hypothetical protein